MTSLPLVKRVAAAIALVLLGTSGVAHAGAGTVGTPVPIVFGERIEATQAVHTKCVYEEGVCLYTFFHTLKITGQSFSPSGTVIVYVRHNQAGAAFHHYSTTASLLGGAIALDSNKRYCGTAGWLVKAFDVTRQSFSNTVTVAPCSAP